MRELEASILLNTFALIEAESKGKFSRKYVNVECKAVSRASWTTDGISTIRVLSELMYINL
jgi:hypothetical protein